VGEKKGGHDLSQNNKKRERKNTVCDCVARSQSERRVDEGPEKKRHYNL